jgi:hypothetical protein
MFMLCQLAEDARSLLHLFLEKKEKGKKKKITPSV